VAVGAGDQALPGLVEEGAIAGEDLARDGADRAGEAADSFALAAAVGRGYEPKQAPAAVADWLVQQAKAARSAGRSEEARRALRDAVRTDPANLEAAEMLHSLGDG